MRIVEYRLPLQDWWGLVIRPAVNAERLDRANRAASCGQRLLLGARVVAMLRGGQ